MTWEAWKWEPNNKMKVTTPEKVNKATKQPTKVATPEKINKRSSSFSKVLEIKCNSTKKDFSLYYYFAPGTTQAARNDFQKTASYLANLTKAMIHNYANRDNGKQVTTNGSHLQPHVMVFKTAQHIANLHAYVQANRLNYGNCNYIVHLRVDKSDFYGV